jgi:hypothetical protein
MPTPRDPLRWLRCSLRCLLTYFVYAPRAAHSCLASESACEAGDLPPTGALRHQFDRKTLWPSATFHVECYMEEARRGSRSAGGLSLSSPASWPKLSKNVSAPALRRRGVH